MNPELVKGGTASAALLVGGLNEDVPTLSAGDISQHLLLVAGAKLTGDGMTMSVIAA